MDYVRLVPTIINSVKAIEALMPQSSGKDKLDAAIKMIEEVYGVVSENLPQIIAFITTLVSLFNSIGIFKKKQ